MSFKSVLIFPTSLDNMAVSGLGGRESPLNENKRKKEKRERSQPQKRLKLFNPNFKIYFKDSIP